MTEHGINGYREFAYRSGGEISYQTARRILLGEAKQLRRSTLDSIAGTFGVEVTELMALTNTDNDGWTGEPWILPQEFDLIPLELRRSIERAMRDTFTYTGLIRKDMRTDQSRDHEP